MNKYLEKKTYTHKYIKGQISLAMIVVALIIASSLLSVYIFGKWNVLFRNYKSQAAIQGLAEKIMTRVKTLALHGSYDEPNCGEFASNAFSHKNVFNKLRKFTYPQSVVWELGVQQSALVNPNDPFGSAMDVNIGLPAFNQNGWLYGCIITLEEAENVLWKPPGGWNNDPNDRAIRVKVTMSGTPDFLNLSREVSVQIELDGSTGNGDKAGTYTLNRTFSYRVPFVNDFNIILHKTYIDNTLIHPKITNTSNANIEINGSVLVITEGNRQSNVLQANHTLLLDNFIGSPSSLFSDVNQRLPRITFNEGFATTAHEVLTTQIALLDQQTADSSYSSLGMSEYNPRIIQNIFKKGIETGAFNIRADLTADTRLNIFNLPKYNSSIINDPAFHIINNYEINPDPALKKVQPIPYYPIVDSNNVVHDCISETNATRCNDSDYHWLVHPSEVPGQSLPHIIPSIHPVGATYGSGTGLVKLSDSCVKEFTGSNASQPTGVGETFVFQRASEDLTIRFEAGQELPGSNDFIFCGMIVAKTLRIYAPIANSRIQMLGNFIVSEIQIYGSAPDVSIQFNNPKDDKPLLVNINSIPTRSAGTVGVGSAFNNYGAITADMIFSSQTELFKQWHNHFRDTSSHFFLPLTYKTDMDMNRFNKSPFLPRVPSFDPDPPSQSNTNVPCFNYSYFGKFPKYQYVIDSNNQHNTLIDENALCTFVDRVSPAVFPLATVPSNHLIDENIIKYNGCDETLSGPLQNSWSSPKSFENQVLNKNTVGFTDGLVAGTFNADYCYPHLSPGTGLASNQRDPAYGGGDKIMPNYYVYFVNPVFYNSNVNPIDMTQSKLANGTIISQPPPTGNDPAAGVYGGRWRNLETANNPPFSMPGGPTLWLNFAPNVYKCVRSATNKSFYQGLPAPYNNACVFRSSNYNGAIQPLTNDDAKPISDTDRFGFCDCYGSDISNNLVWVMEKSI